MVFSAQGQFVLPLYYFFFPYLFEGALNHEDGVEAEDRRLSVSMLVPNHGIEVMLFSRGSKRSLIKVSTVMRFTQKILAISVFETLR